MPDYVDWFVNREKQYLGFQKMLAGQAKRSIMVVEAAADMGKTWLLQRMRHYAEEQGVHVAHINFAERRALDYLSIVRFFRDQIGAENFNHLTETINNFTSVNVNFLGGSGRSGGVQFNTDVGADNANVSLTAQEVAGRDIIKDNVVTDNQFYIQADSDVARRAAEIQINDAFFTCLKPLLAAGMVVFLFDSYEAIVPEADAWIKDQLLLRLSESQLNNVIVILAGQRAPELSSDQSDLVAKTGLNLFSEDHVKEYILDRRGIQGLDLGTIFRTSGGYPGLLAKMADVAVMDEEDDDDWL